MSLKWLYTHSKDFCLLRGILFGEVCRKHFEVNNVRMNLSIKNIQKYLLLSKKNTTFAPHSVKGSRWESCTVPLLWFAIRYSKSWKSLVLNELGRLNVRSDKSEDLLHAINHEVGELNALGESSQRHDRQVFNIITVRARVYAWYKYQAYCCLFMLS